jgi:hypothetical protein
MTYRSEFSPSGRCLFKTMLWADQRAVCLALHAGRVASDAALSGPCGGGSSLLVGHRVKTRLPARDYPTRTHGRLVGRVTSRIPFRHGNGPPARQPRWHTWAVRHFRRLRLTGARLPHRDRRMVMCLVRCCSCLYRRTADRPLFLSPHVRGSRMPVRNFRRCGIQIQLLEMKSRSGCPAAIVKSLR